jgi:hypothetical protein
MNIKALDKLEKGWCKIKWEDWKNKSRLSIDQLESIIDTINKFKSNKSVNELALAKIKNTSIYITISKNEYNIVLDWIYDKMIEFEKYEICEEIIEIKKHL